MHFTILWKFLILKWTNQLWKISQIKCRIFSKSNLYLKKSGVKSPNCTQSMGEKAHLFIGKIIIVESFIRLTKLFSIAFLISKVTIYSKLHFLLLLCKLLRSSNKSLTSYQTYLLAFWMVKKRTEIQKKILCTWIKCDTEAIWKNSSNK